MTTKAGTTFEPTPEPVHNPWEKEPIVVGLDSVDEPTKRQERAVRGAIEYWNTNGSEYADWEPNFVFEPNATDPDLLIRFEHIIVYCSGYHADTTLGCAPHLEVYDRVYDSERVQIKIGLTNESTYRIVRHELGHVLGLEHGEEPEDVMAPYDLALDSVYRVNIDYDNPGRHDRAKSRQQVQHTLDYYNAGAEGQVTEDVSLEIVDESVNIDIQITFTDGQGPDGSIASFEEDTYHIEVEDIDDDRKGWHVGYWLGWYFGANSTSELPPPFDEPEDDVREYWWR